MFRDRQEAGQLLAKKLKDFKGKKTAILGLARGGVVVAAEIAKVLRVPLDVLVVKKIGAPGNEELAIGAVGPDNVVIWDERLCQSLGVDEKIKKEKLKVRNKERRDQEKFLRGDRPALNLREKTVILVDDGIATGSTVEAAIKWIRSQKPLKIILAVPVASLDAVEKLKSQVDELICLRIESDFWAVGQFYEEFDQVSDQEALKLLSVNS